MQEFLIIPIIFYHTQHVPMLTLLHYMLDGFWPDISSSVPEVLLECDLWESHHEEDNMMGLADMLIRYAVVIYPIFVASHRWSLDRCWNH